MDQQRIGRKSVRDSCGAQGSLTLFISEGRVNTRQSGFFPLATTSVGRVPDQHTRRAKAKRRTRSAAESCAGGLPTENGAPGEALVVSDTKCRSGRSEVLILFVAVQGCGIGRRAEAISDHHLVCQQCAEDSSLADRCLLVQRRT